MKSAFCPRVTPPALEAFLSKQQLCSKCSTSCRFRLPHKQAPAVTMGAVRKRYQPRSPVSAPWRLCVCCPTSVSASGRCLARAMEQRVLLHVHRQDGERISMQLVRHRAERIHLAMVAPLYPHRLRGQVVSGRLQWLRLTAGCRTGMARVALLQQGQRQLWKQQYQRAVGENVSPKDTAKPFGSCRCLSSGAWKAMLSRKEMCAPGVLKVSVTWLRWWAAFGKFLMWGQRAPWGRTLHLSTL